MLQMHNSLTRKKEPFTPLQPGKISLYVCGITVYDHCHLGHARSMVCFDVIVRFLRNIGYQVTYVRNITDIDDKIIVRAHERGIQIQELTTQYIDAMVADCKALYILPPDKEPRATAYVQPMINLIEKLLQTGYAYVSDNGDVCYEVAKFAAYGQLSQKDIDGLEAGARIEVVQAKRSPLDFVLWKMAKPDEPSWPSPWGQGRPGWHLECSAMAMGELGEQFDIHGGGLDLQFPHHENEIAQSEGASGKQFARYWLHVGMLQVNQAKMAKSTGNFFTIADILRQYNPETVRYFLLSSHYRSTLHYSAENIQLAGKALTRLYQSIRDIPITATKLENSWSQQFYAAMNDDFNTPVALSVLFTLSHEINKTKSPELAYTLKQLAGILGLLQDSPATFLQAADMDTPMRHNIEKLIQDREQARLQRDWSKADSIRELLSQQGISLEDTPEGTLWRKD